MKMMLTWLKYKSWIHAKKSCLTCGVLQWRQEAGAEGAGRPG